jgi:hypothetical protein
MRTHYQVELTPNHVYLIVSGWRETNFHPGLLPRLTPHAFYYSKGAEPQFRNPRCRLLWDTWRNVWLLAWERQRRLQERLNYLIELEKVKNFSWDDWRKRVS